MKRDAVPVNVCVYVCGEGELVINILQPQERLIYVCDYFRRVGEGQKHKNARKIKPTKIEMINHKPECGAELS